MSVFKKYLSVILCLAILIGTMSVLGGICTSADSATNNLLQNGDFSNGLTNWLYSNNMANASSMEVTNNMLYIPERTDSTASGAYNRYINQAVTLQPGDYVFSFDADLLFSAVKSTSFAFGIDTSLDSYTRPQVSTDSCPSSVTTTVSVSESDELTTNDTVANIFDVTKFKANSKNGCVYYYNPEISGRFVGKISVEFTLTEEETLYFSIGCAATNTSAYIDNINLSKVIITDYIENGDFSKELSNWTFSENISHSESISVSNGVCYIPKKTGSTSPAYNRYISQQITLPNGSYVFAFDADVIFESAATYSFAFGIDSSINANSKAPVLSTTSVTTNVSYDKCDSLTSNSTTVSDFDSSKFVSHSKTKSIHFYHPGNAGRYVGRIYVSFTLAEETTLYFYVGCPGTDTYAYIDNVELVNYVADSFNTQHMEVDFNDYAILNGNGIMGTTDVTETSKDFGNTRFGVTNDGVAFAIEGTTDKYLHFSVSSEYLNRYYYSDRAITINPTGGITKNNSYYIDSDGRYSVKFDYQVDKAEGLGDVYVLVFSNSAYTVKTTTINKDTNVLAEIKLDSSIPSTNKSGWYTAFADLEMRTDEAEISSLVFVFATSMRNESGSKPGYDVSNNFPYDINLDNVIADRLGAMSFVYPSGNVDTSYGIPSATALNKSSESSVYSSSNVFENRTCPLGNYKWYYDKERTIPVTEDSLAYSSKNPTYYANSTLKYDTNNDELIDSRDLVRTKKYEADNSISINVDSLGEYESFNALYMTGQRKYLLGADGVSENPFEAYSLQLEFYDDFNDASLNSDVWSTSNGVYSTHISSLRTPDDQYLQNGYLNLEISKMSEPWEAVSGDDTYSGYFQTGNIASKNEFGYGYYEASYKYPIGDSENCNCSFWLINDSDSTIPTEIDINEGRMPSLVSTNLHLDGNQYKSNYTADSNLSEGFHRYGLLWTEDCLKWYLDGVCIRTADISDMNLTSDSDMRIRLSLALMKLSIGGLDYPVTSDYYDIYANEFDELAGQTMQVDYVRYYSIK